MHCRSCHAVDLSAAMIKVEAIEVLQGERIRLHVSYATIEAIAASGNWSDGRQVFVDVNGCVIWKT